MMDTARIKRRYLQFADTECKGYSDIYYRLSLAVAEHDELIGFIGGMPVIQPNLFFAAIQLLTGPDCMPQTGSALQAFVRRHGEEIGAIMRSHTTQTNEVGRCAVLLPALPPGPLALLEVGSSAGLCLLLDRFRYEFGSVAIGEASSSVRMSCVVSGRVPLPPVMPRIVWRRGLDLSPIDVRDEGAVRWLLACVYPDQRERRRRLESAIDLARADPPVVMAGDLVDDLPAQLAEAPADAQLVVVHSAVLTYVRSDRRQAFAGILSDASRRRDIVWLSNEPAGVIREVSELAPPQSDLRYLLGRTRFTNGQRQDDLLGIAHPHGAELEWL